MTTAGAEMLTKKFGVKMDSHMSKEQLAIARAFRSVQTDMRRNNKNTRLFYWSVFPDHKTQREKWQKKNIFCEDLGFILERWRPHLKFSSTSLTLRRNILQLLIFFKNIFFFICGHHKTWEGSGFRFRKKTDPDPEPENVFLS